MLIIFFSSFLYGGIKRFSTYYALLSSIERWRLFLDEQVFAGTLLKDLLKVKYQRRYLSKPKLNTYRFSIVALEVLFSYLQDKWQSIKTNTTFNSWNQLLQGVPKRSVLSPMLFNIYINDIFFVLKETDICNFSDDKTPYVCGSNLKSVLEK